MQRQPMRPPQEVHTRVSTLTSPPAASDGRFISKRRHFRLLPPMGQGVSLVVEKERDARRTCCDPRDITTSPAGYNTGWWSVLLKAAARFLYQSPLCFRMRACVG